MGRGREEGGDWKTWPAGVNAGVVGETGEDWLTKDDLGWSCGEGLDLYLIGMSCKATEGAKSNASLWVH